MASSSQVGRHDGAREETALWKFATAVALVAIVALPRLRSGAVRRPAGQASDSKSDTSHDGADAEAVARAEVDRGRQADTPSEIPAKGWKDIGLRVFHDLSENRLVAVAAGVTFYVLLAIFPAVAALVSCYGLFADASTINDQIAALSSFMPSGAVDIVGEQVKRLTEEGNAKLGLTFFTGLVLSVWSANGGMKAVFDALNVVHGEREKRSFVWLNLRSLLFTAGALLFVIVALFAIVVVPLALQYFGLSNQAWLIAALRWPALLVVLVLSLSVLYRFGPSRDAPRWRWVTWGAVLAALLWVGGSVLFSWYVSNFGSYNKTYGSLGAAIGFMTWIWISTIIVLLGAELNAEIEHQTAKDSTVGPPETLGRRGARMADTVGTAAR